MPDSQRKRTNHWCWLTLAVLVSVFLFFVFRFRIPGKGFTAMLDFGDLHAHRVLPEVDPATTFFTKESTGYDSQWYAQLAITPNLGDPRLHSAIDNLPYRARRILFPWTAFALGLGNPRWVLEAFAVQGVIAWLLLGWLLLRWLPPENWGNLFRWTCVMFSFGMAFSVRGALVDGPSLLLIATGMALLEKGRPWLAALTLGISGLGKETSILAATALVAPPEAGRRFGWLQSGLRGLVVAAPLLLWSIYLVFLFGWSDANTGARNFDPPFVGLWNKFAGNVHELASDPPVFAYTIGGTFTVVSLVTQFLFFALRPRWRDPWWRLGAPYALLMAVLGESVWEGYPSAAARVLLPMLLAFNLIVPRGRRWWPVLLLGNITILSTPNFTRLPLGYEPGIVDGPARLATSTEDGGPVSATLEGPWYPAEQSLRETWRWTGGAVEMRIHNPYPFAVRSTLSFGLNSRTERTVQVRIEEKLLWQGTSTAKRNEIRIPGIVIPPGDPAIRLSSDGRAQVSADSADPRPLDFRVFDLRLTVEGPASAP